MKRNIALIAFGLFAALGLVFVLKSTNNSASPGNYTNSISQSVTSGSSQKYSASDVAKHSTKSDYWTIVDGAVYNITSYISEHPGGSEILQACGIDSTQMLNGMGAKGRNNEHSQNARDILNGLQIGALSN